MMLPLIVLVSLPCLLASVAAFPLADGFPNPNSSQLSQIENHSFGSLSNAALPLNISSEGIKNLQVIALNELAEVAFFAQLLANITNNVEGYQIPDATHDYILEALLAAQHVSERGVDLICTDNNPARGAPRSQRQHGSSSLWRRPDYAV